MATPQQTAIYYSMVILFENRSSRSHLALFLPRFSFSLIVLVQSPSLGSFLLLVGIALDPSSSRFFTPYISALIPSPLFLFVFFMTIL